MCNIIRKGFCAYMELKNRVLFNSRFYISISGDRSKYILTRACRSLNDNLAGQLIT